ncbi:MAG TPA: SpoIIE family protein phosphatase [Bryobacteraceae bacterium]|jgi:serine phosphatase RsbU (regulator of sigma subunit)|nr:SpoIIE family protein phosphatase [Bryobacteraceae bacterium]
MELLISGPKGQPTTFELKKEPLSLGRSADNDLAYPDDPWLSRFHLCFERQNGETWYVRDCGARNGTVLNSTTLKAPHPIKPGDRIYAGHLTIEVKDRHSETKKNVISFISTDEEKSTREATIVTSLDKVLGKAEVPDQRSGASDSGLQSARFVKALIRAGQELAGHSPLEELFPAILKLALSATGAKRGVILTLENGDLVVKASEGAGFALSTAVRDRVLRDRCSLVIGDAMLDDVFRMQKSIVLQRVRSMMAVPLQTGDRVIGIIYVDNGTLMRPFSQEDLDLLTVMSNVAAIRIEHARLNAIEQADKIFEMELAQASEIQRSLLPPHAPVYSGYELAGLNIPCRTVGGDYYDFLPYPDGRLGVVVGDVSGKGLPAAMMMSNLQARVQMLVDYNPDPARAITVLNRNLAEHGVPGRFITFFYGLLDPATGLLEYSNAGHNYPVILRANEEIEDLPGSGMVMGIMAKERYERAETYLRPGDLLALYSDGVTEAVNEKDKEFGEHGLGKFLLRNRHQSCGDLVNALAEEVRGWCRSTSFADDFTVLLVRRNPA